MGQFGQALYVGRAGLNDGLSFRPYESWSGRPRPHMDLSHWSEHVAQRKSGHVIRGLNPVLDLESKSLSEE